MKKRTYILGNNLRGYFEGTFGNDEEAWKWLSKRFLLSHPARGGRNVTMHREEIHYGFKQMIHLKSGVTPHSRIDRDSVIKKCKSTFFMAY